MPVASVFFFICNRQMTSNKCPLPKFFILADTEKLLIIFKNAQTQMEFQERHCKDKAKWYLEALKLYFGSCLQSLENIIKAKEKLRKTLDDARRNRGKYGSRESDDSDLYNLTLDSLENLASALQTFVDDSTNTTEDMDVDRAENPLYGRLGTMDHVMTMTAGDLRSTVFQRLVALLQKFQRVDDEFRAICDKLGSLLTTV